MRQMTLSNRADPAAFEDEAELIPNPVTDSTMETEPFTAAHEVTRIGSEGILGRDLVGRSTIGILYQGDVGGKRANRQP